VIKFPSVTFSIVPAQQLAGTTAQRVLIVGQKLSTGSATDGAVYRDFGNDGSEDGLFDKTSHIAGLVRSFKEINKVSYLDVLPLTDGTSAVKGTAVITLATGPAGSDSTVYVTVGSASDYRKEITITEGDTVAEIGDLIVAAYATDLKKPFTIANSAGVITATATNGGTLSNDWGLNFEGTIEDVTVTLAGWSGGSVDPVLTSALDAIGETRYQTVLWPSSYDLDVIQTLLDARFNTTNNILDGVAFQQKTDTMSNLKSYVSPLNSQSVVVAGQKKISDSAFIGSACLEFPDVACSQICAIRALRLTQDAVLTDYLTTVAEDDQYGGIGIAGLPYANTSLPNLPIASPANQFSQIDISELTSHGVATYGPNRAFNGTIFGEFVTTYLTDTAGNPDTSFKFLNTIDQESVVREYFFENLKTRYAQTRVTTGDLVAGRDMANEASIRAFCNRLYDALAEEVLVEKGTEAKKDYNENLSISIDIASGVATINQAPLLIGQMRSILGTIQVNFGG